VKKYFILFIVIFTCLLLNLKAYSASNIDTVIDSNPISKTAIISMSVRDANTGNVIYSRNEKLLLHPASTLKAFVSPVILDRLGENYKLTTSFYMFKNKLYIKLSGDPLLTTDDLNIICHHLKNKGVKKINSIIIDDSVIDNVQWGKGWMWDDADNADTPKYSAYNLNHNLIKNQAGSLIPVDDPKENFIAILKETLKLNKIKLKGNISSGNISSDSVLLDSISHDLLQVLKQMDQNSDNLIAETLLKIAGKDSDLSVGTTNAGIEKFKNYYNKLGLETNNLYIVDASGVSHYNLMQTDWMTHALVKIFKSNNFNVYINTLATPGNGTLTNRFQPLHGRIWAKTGTLSGISGLTGYVKTNSNNFYVFAILTQNYIGDPSKAKDLENQLVNEILKL